MGSGRGHVNQARARLSEWDDPHQWPSPPVRAIICCTKDRLSMKDLRFSDVVSGRQGGTEFHSVFGVHRLIGELWGDR